MTLVHFEYFRPTKDGVDIPVVGRLEFTLHRREIDGDRYRIEATFHVDLVNGVADVDLSPTAVDQAWRVKELAPIAGRMARGRWFTVPDAAVINAVDLVEVDPATLDPVAVPEAAWWVEAARLESLIGTGGGGGGISIVDNGDGTLTLTGSSVVDNGDGTLTL